ncbi:MAG: cyclophilin-like family protein [Hyphomicrobiaceae bacterium]
MLIRAGSVALRASSVGDTNRQSHLGRAADHGTAETWGSAIHFETHVETGREPRAKALVQSGDIAFWSEDDRIIIPFGLTPLSRPGEMRLPVPQYLG